MFGNFKDTDREILLKIDSDRELLNTCSLNKYFYGLCDDMFFRNRIVYKYPLSLKNKPEGMKWKQYYLKLVYIIGKIKEDFGFEFTSGDPEKYYNILKTNSIHSQFRISSYHNYTDLIDYLIYRENNKPDNWKYPYYLKWGIYGAAEGNHEELIDWYLTHDENNLINSALDGAVKGGNIKLVEKLILKGSNDFDGALVYAGEYGHRDIINLLIRKGGNINEALYGASFIENPNKDLIEYIIEKGANVEEVIREAEQNGELKAANLLRKYL